MPSLLSASLHGLFHFIALPLASFTQHVTIEFGSPHIFHVEFLLHGLGCCEPDGPGIRTDGSRHFCRLSLYWVVLLSCRCYCQFCKLTLYWVAFGSRLGCAKLVLARTLCSTRVYMICLHGKTCMGRRSWCVAGSPLLFRPSVCSRPSAIPGCGVLTT